MKTILAFFLSSCFTTSAFAQCVKGDCKNGKGSYDFGFAQYEGEFKNGKPDGVGTMDFGGGDKYVGEFKEGAEHGKGILFKQNKLQEVIYVNGKIVQQQSEFVIGGNALKVEGCIGGDCYNGYGEIKFGSGSMYKGNFVYGMREGNGTFYFASGNILEGQFKHDLPLNGKFNYANEGVSFRKFSHTCALRNSISILSDSAALRKMSWISRCFWESVSKNRFCRGMRAMSSRTWEELSKERPNEKKVLG